MNSSKHQQFMRNVDLAFDTEQNKLENEVETMFRDTVNFLKKFALFLNITKGEDQKLVMGADLVGISSEFLNLNLNDSLFIFNINELYKQYTLELCNNGQFDINSAILQLTHNCLLYILNRLKDENANLTELLEYFRDLKKSILVFCVSPVILETHAFIHLVGYWMVDLLRMITGADGDTKCCAKNYVIFNVIQEILISLSKCNIFTDLLVREISKKIESVMSYYDANKNFDDYIVSKLMVFEYLLLIMKTIICNANHRGYALANEGVARMRLILEMLGKCLGGKCPRVLTNIVKDILKML